MPEQLSEPVYFMRDSNGVPHPSTCGIFGLDKKCTCRSNSQLEAAAAMIDAAAQVAEELANEELV